MKQKIIGILICMLLIGTLIPATKIVIGKNNPSENQLLESNSSQVGVRWMYRSIMPIQSPDGKNYSCIMYCNNHNQALNWISLIDELGFEKAWQKHFMKLAIIFMLPGTILLFGLNDFMLWYLGLFIKQKHKVEFLNCLNSYDQINGTGIITYSWVSELKNKPFDFRSQPDDSWVENSWILGDNCYFIPNPEIWEKISVYV